MDAASKKGEGRRVELTTRDRELLLSLYKYRFLSLSQVERLHFVSSQTARRRVRLLSSAGYLRTFRVPGVGDRVTFLTQQGLDHVAGNMEVPAGTLGNSRARLRPRDSYFLNHFLAVTDVRIAVAQACARHPDLSLLGFLADHVMEHRDRSVPRRIARDVAADIARPGEKVGHTPDGVFAIARGVETALFFLEVDRGTESVANRERGFAKTIRFYLNYLAQGGYARYRDVFGVTASFTAVRVLVATSSVRRLATIRSVGAALAFQPAKALRLIWLSEIGTISEGTIFDRIWVSLDPEDAGKYRIAGGRDLTSSDEGALAHDH
ncbi:MAG: replication-relaxation family protein [Candidatus Eisenbacteria bacterium]